MVEAEEEAPTHLHPRQIMAETMTMTTFRIPFLFQLPLLVASLSLRIRTNLVLALS